MKKKLLIFGAGGHAIKISHIAKSSSFDVIGYISTESKGTMINDLPVLGYLDFYKTHKELNKYATHIGIGENSIRHKIFNSINSLSKNITTIQSSNCIISINSYVGQGCFLAQGAIVQNNVSIGKCSIVDTGAIVDHDSMVGDFVTISPNAVVCSHVKIGNGAIVGAGATIIEKVSIGENSLIGAGSVVINNIEPNVVAVGNPAKIIQKRNFYDRYLK